MPPKKKGNAKKPNIVEFEDNNNKKKRGRPSKATLTEKEKDEQKYFSEMGITAVTNPSYPPAAMPELFRTKDPLENTQFYLPRRKSSRYPTATYAPVIKNNPYLEATRGPTGYTDSDSYGRSFRYRDPVYDNTEREILKEGMITPPRRSITDSPTTPELLSALKGINDSPVRIPTPLPSPLPPIYPDLDDDFELFIMETPTPKPSKSKSKKKRRKTSKGGKKTIRKSKKRNTKKVRKY